MKQFLRVNSFVIGIVLSVVLAGMAPEWGGENSVLPVGFLRLAGVFLIFFNQGVVLPAEELRRGFLEWKLHVYVQLCTYLLFPLMIGLGLWLSSSFFVQEDLRLGFLLLAFTPTTLTSAVALVTLARGNVTGALFNCTLSSVIGVFWVPIMAVTFMGAGGVDGHFAMGDMLGDIAMTILLPLVLGQLARPLLKTFFGRHKTFLRRFNSGVILYIVWAAFCQSFLRNVWSDISGTDLAFTMVGVFLTLGTGGALVWLGSGWLGLPARSRITAFYCGSQKTIAMGLPLSIMIFSGEDLGIELSLLVLPLLIYHPSQLILGGWLLPRLQRFAARP